MKALAVLGTASGVGKSWVATAFCAWLRRQGVRVAPFKAQNMSNNSWATADGREIARAQAVQAEACGLAPEPAMNPILLKPSGKLGSQCVLDGRAVGHLEAADYFRHRDRLWTRIAEALEGWRSRCEVLVLEGAGSPVELNLMEQDLANLRPIRHLGGRWVLVGDIDRGGIYAQLAGTWALLPPADRGQALGAIVNRFRGDPALFAAPEAWLAPHAPGLPVLGTLPFRTDLQPEEEDGLGPADADRGSGDLVAWVRLPHAANVSDAQPWWLDSGVRTLWTDRIPDLDRARVVVIPGSKNTIADLRWLRASGLGEAIRSASARGALVIGICGGFQILGESLADPEGVAGDAGEEPGLGLLPAATRFLPEKCVRQGLVRFEGREWTAYEIHMGRTQFLRPVPPWFEVRNGESFEEEGARHGRVWGTYLHGCFEAPEVRSRVAAVAGFGAHRAGPGLWTDHRKAVYSAMADLLESSLDLGPVRRHLGL